MINIDMWYRDKKEDADRIDIFFSDIGCVYRGNIYKGGKIIGDYSCDNSLELEKAFQQLAFNWD